MSLLKTIRMTDSERIADDSDMESIEDGDNICVNNIIMNRPDLLAALQNRFQITNVIQNLPAPVKRRVKALKQLQLAQVKIEAKFYEDVHVLECKYNKMCAELHDKRSNIVSGIYEPTDEESVWETDNEEDDIANDIKEKVKIEEGFILEFHFEPNEYFSNSVLTKEYLMKCAPEKNDPFSFEGPEIHKSKGCTIDWKKGKNVTVKTIKKNQKHKSRGHVRTVTKTVQNDSFFNFFTPPVVPDDTEVDLDEDMKALLTSDFEIGHYIRERLVPRAVLYYTGEGLEDEGDDYEEDEDDEDNEDDEDDDDEDDDDEYSPHDNKNNKTGGDQRTAECKQQ
ncbi:hypothetical protein G9C98_000894 [Cotesia typhae]|uniref:Nucleosome assembly protein 1-like 1 n=1 Tax=Cotesia typhae TaxID=2053667 RepID=A0A8J5VBA4_9HYME|nr:hypothetical protein G9C98_000894 [Cotesia typhae]